MSLTPKPVTPPENSVFLQAYRKHTELSSFVRVPKPKMAMTVMKEPTTISTLPFGLFIPVIMVSDPEIINNMPKFLGLTKNNLGKPMNLFFTLSDLQ
jgi:hypothetical protein